jgi:hypothetical protein
MVGFEYADLNAGWRFVDLAEVFFQVHPSGECFARPGQNEHLRALVLFDVVEHADHVGVECRVHRVAFLGAIQADPRDACGDLELDVVPVRQRRGIGFS